MDEAAFSALIERCYDTAFDEASWSTLLQEVAINFDCVGANVVRLGEGEPLVAYSPGIAHAAAAYASEWVDRDPWLAYMLDKQLGVGCYVDIDHISAEVRGRDPFYQDFRRSLGMSSTLSLILRPCDDVQLGFGASRNRHAEFVSRRERERFAELGRHLARASGLSFRMNAAESLNKGLCDALMRFDCAVAVVRKGARLLRSNALLHALEADGLSVQRGRLLAREPAMQSRLERLIAQVLAAAPSASLNVVALARRGSALPLLVRGVALSAQVADQRLGVPEPAGLFLTLRPGMAGYPALDHVLMSLGLMKGQARYALAVGSGLTIGEAAALFEVSDETARTMLKQIYVRLGINRQSQLARLVAQIAPFER